MNIASWKLPSVIYCTPILNVQFLVRDMHVQDGSVETSSAVFAQHLFLTKINTIKLTISLQNQGVDHAD